MRIFRDDAGRVWQMQINVGTVKKCRRVFSEDGKPFELTDPALPTKLANDPGLFVDLLWELVDRTQHPDVKPEQFAEALAGDSLDAAEAAFIEALFDFFPKARRELNRAIYQKIRSEQSRIIHETVEKIRGTSSSDVTSSGESSE